MKLNIVYSFLSFGIFIIKVIGSTLIKGIIIVLNENLSLNIKTLTSEYIIVIISTTNVLILFVLYIYYSWNSLIRYCHFLKLKYTQINGLENKIVYIINSIVFKKNRFPLDVLIRLAFKNIAKKIKPDNQDDNVMILILIK